MKAGDNLTKIAIQHRVSVAEPAEANVAKTLAMLRPGQTLNIPPVRAAALATRAAASTPRKTEEPPKLNATARGSIR